MSAQHTTGSLKTYQYKDLTVYYTPGPTLHDIRDSDGQFVSINLKEQKEIVRRINEQE